MKQRIFTLLLILAFALAACAQVPAQTAPLDDQSVIGSTDGIFALGMLIIAITSAPLLFRKKKK